MNSSKSREEPRGMRREPDSGARAAVRAANSFYERAADIGAGSETKVESASRTVDLRRRLACGLALFSSTPYGRQYQFTIQFPNRSLDQFPPTVHAVTGKCLITVMSSITSVRIIIIDIKFHTLVSEISEVSSASLFSALTLPRELC